MIVFLALSCRLLPVCGPFLFTSLQSARRNRPIVLFLWYVKNWPTVWSRAIEKVIVFLASQGISNISQNPKVHNYVKNSLPLVSHLSQMSPFHAFTLFL